LMYWNGLRFDRRRVWLALLLAVFYAITDEYHQSYVPGRHPSWVDALVIDGGGAALALGLVNYYLVKKNRTKKNE
jgi:VanZ family protein